MIVKSLTFRQVQEGNANAIKELIAISFRFHEEMAEFTQSAGKTLQGVAELPAMMGYHEGRLPNIESR